MGRHKKQHLKQRKDGRFVAVYKGKQFMAYSEEEALAARQEYINNEKEGISPSRTVQSFGLEWLPAAHPKKTVSDTTYVGLAIHMEKLLRQIGHLSLRDVTPMDILHAYAAEYDGLSTSYIRAAKQLFCAMFDAAMESGYCRTNPARSASARPHKGTYKGHRAITDQERQWIHTYCHDHRAYPAIITMLYAGIRPQEAKALTIEKAYDPEAGVLHITETAHRNGNNQYVITGKGKTPRAIRDVPVFAPVAEALNNRKGLLITTAKGKQITATTWRNAMQSYKACMEAAINGCQKRWYGRMKIHKEIIASGGELPPWQEFNITPYDLRKSFCTFCCRDLGVEINTTIHWMGHADAKMVLAVYDDWSPSRGREEAKKVEKALGNMQFDMQNNKPKPEGNDNPEP